MIGSIAAGLCTSTVWALIVLIIGFSKKLNIISLQSIISLAIFVCIAPVLWCIISQGEPGASSSPIQD